MTKHQKGKNKLKWCSVEIISDVLAKSSNACIFQKKRISNNISQIVFNNEQTNNEIFCSLNL